MERVSIRSVASLVAVMAVIVVSTAGASTLGPAPVLVTIGSPVSPFSQNKQNEPAVAVDPASSNVLVAGSNDNIDMELCKAGDPTTCPFTPGVGSSGVYFSFDSGASWTQPTYSGWSARGCTGPAECTPAVGPIGTLPGYFPAGLVSDGDPSVAFGPQPDGHGGFSYVNGARLYYGNLASNFASTRSDTTFNGVENIAVSHADDVQAAASGSAAAWSAPALVGKQNSALFNDKDTVWADNSATSRFFGRVYVCNTSFRGQEKGNAAPGPILFYRSTDGGTTWSNPTQLSAATNNPSTGGRQDCAVRTNSQGTVFAFWDGFVGSTGVGAIYQARSTDGGQSFEKARAIATFTPCGIFDPPNGAPSFDGAAGTRTSTEPLADIANGAPTGGDATNEIVLTYCDGQTPTAASPGPNEKAVVIYSTDGGNTYTSAGNAADSTDRPDFPAIAISPNGTDVWLTYDAFLQPWQSDSTTPRLMQGVVRHSDLTAGVPGAWSDVERAPIGDARASSANSLTSGFIGDYNYAAATRTAGIAVWNDTSNAADCPAVDTYRAALLTGATPTPPATNTDCPATFGNTDISSAAINDPTP